MFFQFYVSEISFAFKSYLQLVVDFIVKIFEKQKKPFYPLDCDVSKLDRQVTDFLRRLCCTYIPSLRKQPTLRFASTDFCNQWGLNEHKNAIPMTYLWLVEIFFLQTQICLLTHHQYWVCARSSEVILQGGKLSGMSLRNVCRFPIPYCNARLYFLRRSFRSQLWSKFWRDRNRRGM